MRSKTLPITILVTGAGGSAAYNFIDSLRLSSHPYIIIGVDTNREHLALSNADYKYLVPPLSKPQSYINSLNHLIVKHQIQLIHPQPDPEVAFISLNSKKLKTPIFLPQTETINRCHDKFIAVHLFRKAQIPVAESFLINSLDDLKLAVKKLKLKHQKMWLRATHGAGSKAALPIASVDQGESWINYWAKNKGIGYGDFMLSEFLPGKEFAFQSLWQNGQCLVSQARERCEYVFGNLTPSGQSSSPSVALTVHRDDVNQIASQAILAIDPQATGVFCVDLKENNSGMPCVIEINPGRFFTTSNFFSHAGCNMPDYYVKMALGKKLPPLKPYNSLKAGLYWLRIIDMGYKLIDSDWGIDGDFTRQS